MNHRWVKLAIAVMLVASLGLATGCKRTIEVQTGTRIVDSQGRVISEDIKTVRVPPETASAYRIVTITQPDTATEVASNYNQAQSAIVAGNMALAKELLGKVVAQDPTYRSAKKQLDTINAGKKPAPDKTAPSAPTTSTTPPPASTTPTATAGGLVRWIPDTVTGFTAQKAAIDPLSVSRQYTPAAGSPAASLVIYAEQFRSSAEAKRALSSQVKQRYTRNSSGQTINGHTVYFGTSSGFAAMGFTSGAVMVAIEAAPASGSEEGLKSTLAAVAKNLP